MLVILGVFKKRSEFKRTALFNKKEMKQRDTTFDCIKGILILFLLLYHTIDISKLWLGMSSSYLLSFEVGQFLVTSSWMSISSLA